MWQAKRLSDATLTEISSYDYTTMTAETAAALFWWLRNGLYFETGLDRRDDVLLASYQDMLATPVAAMQAICAFLGLAFRPALIEHISPRGPGGARAARHRSAGAGTLRSIAGTPRRDVAQPARRRRSLTSAP